MVRTHDCSRRRWIILIGWHRFRGGRDRYPRHGIRVVRVAWRCSRQEYLCEEIGVVYSCFGREAVANLSSHTDTTKPSTIFFFSFFWLQIIVKQDLDYELENQTVHTHYVLIQAEGHPEEGTTTADDNTSIKNEDEDDRPLIYCKLLYESINICLPSIGRSRSYYSKKRKKEKNRNTERIFVSVPLFRIINLVLDLW